MPPNRAKRVIFTAEHKRRHGNAPEHRLLILPPLQRARLGHKHIRAQAFCHLQDQAQNLVLPRAWRQIIRLHLIAQDLDQSPGLRGHDLRLPRGGHGWRLGQRVGVEKRDPADPIRRAAINLHRDDSAHTQPCQSKPLRRARQNLGGNLFDVISAADWGHMQRMRAR